MRFRDQYLAKYRGSFEAFVKDLPLFLNTKFFAPQFVWLCDSKGRLITDFVGRFESLHQDLATLSRSIAIDPSGLSHRNVTKHKPYQEYYTTEGRNIVERAYARDVALFDYAFESDSGR
jgi:hypothetical protein